MAHVYLVTAGEHSDYHVIGVFSTKENAESFIKTYKESGKLHNEYYEPEIEEYALDGIHEDDRSLFYVELKNGEAYHCEREDSVVFKVEAPVFQLIKFSGIFSGCCLAKNEEHAIKIASEAWLQYQAIG